MSLRLSQPRSGEALVSQGNRLLVIGGLDSGGLSTADVLELDPVRGGIKTVGTLAEPLHDLAAARLRARILVFGGGSIATTAAEQVLVPNGKAHVVGQLPASASDLSALSLAGHAYVVGGYDGQTTVGSVLEAGASGRLRQIGQLPTAVRYTALAAFGDRIYAFGGELSDGSDTDLIQEIDPGTGRAWVRARLPHTLAHASAITLGGRIYLLGGRAGGQSSAQMSSFDPASGRIEAAGKLPQPVSNAAAATVGRSGYLVGGIAADGRTLSTLIQIR